MNAAAPRWFEYEHLVTFADTNAAGSVYFAQFFLWQGECRERLLAQFYPEFAHQFRQGFAMITESAQLDFFHEAALFDRVRVRLSVTELTRSRIAFAFEFRREGDGALLARGRQAVIWVNSQRHPCLMPDALYDATADYFQVGLEDDPRAR